MTRFTAQDIVFMQMALALAEKGQFTTSPNPSVGCVLVKDGEVIGRGFHFKAGEPHAEVMALREAGDKVQGATAYVTLEPCAHFGRTPPCAKGLIDAGVARVISAICDPNPQVAGKGLNMLADAGIETAVGLLSENAEWLNRGFFKRMRTGRPYVRLKLAMSLDGRTALANGESKWITGELARADVQAERAKACAILSSSATVLADDPLLTVRWQQLPEAVKADYLQEHVRQPIRVILDSTHQVNASQQLFQIPSPVWLVSSTPRTLVEFPTYCEQITLAPSAHYLMDLLLALGQRQINTLWIEAGATLAGALIEAQLVDELIIYTAPKLLGDQARGLCKLPHLQTLAEASQWQLHSLEKIGEDIKTVYHPRRAEST